MTLNERKALLVQLGRYMSSNDAQWQAVKERAARENPWFIPEFIELAASSIAGEYLAPDALQQLVDTYKIPEHNPHPQAVGIVMAGNIPLVGFHDLLCVFLAGHKARIKLSSKDTVLMTHLVQQLGQGHPGAAALFSIEEQLKGCDAYIATGSNNSARYFDYYFSKYPSIIRRNRTSAALLTGSETEAELEQLADDVYRYFGLGCRSVTKLFVPQGYGFSPLLKAFEKYNHLIDHHKYRNNYDYNLALLLLNRRYYMSNGSILLVEEPALFSPIAQLNYEYYTDAETVRRQLSGSNELQCLVSSRDIGFGQAQAPDVCSFADGVDTMAFLMSLEGKKKS